MNLLDFNFFKNKKVFMTGHTGFKGAWLSKILTLSGAELTGYALEPKENPNLFQLSGIEEYIRFVADDIRNFEKLKRAFNSAAPEIVIHLAAQPIVSIGYKYPKYTYETNVMGTVNLMECIKNSPKTVRSFLNVTTDKVYYNNEKNKPFSEECPLNGTDPYSNSKSCSELVTNSYKHSFFTGSQTAISTARAGNVIGGGDFSTDRIIPDCIRSAINKEPILLRNPHSVRPYQHVLEPLFAYLKIIQKQYDNISFADCYNVGPDLSDCITTGELADLFCTFWGESISWKSTDSEQSFKESNFLKLDCRKIHNKLQWKPIWNIKKAVEKTVEWTKQWQSGENISDVMEQQINEYWRNLT